MVEVILGGNVRCERVATGVDCRTRFYSHITCCSLGKHMLVMAGEGQEVFSALFDVRKGPLTASTLRITELAVEGDKLWSQWPSLCSVSGKRALLYFCGQDDMWYCDIRGKRLRMRKLATKMPMCNGFGTVPIRVPGERLLVAGEGRRCTDISLITPNDEPTFEKIGEIPGAGRWWTSTALVGERFVLGFGGTNLGGNLDDLWVFDLRTRKGCPVTKNGEWHPETCWTFLGVKDGTLYILGGNDSTTAHCIPLVTLPSLILCGAVRVALRSCLGIPVPPSSGIERRGARDSAPAWL